MNQFEGLKKILCGGAPEPVVEENPESLADGIECMMRWLWENTHGHPDVDCLYDPETDDATKQNILDWYTEHTKTCKDPTNPLKLDVIRFHRTMYGLLNGETEGTG